MKYFSICIVLFGCIYLSEAKGYHKVRTYFQRVDKDGEIIDVNSEEYKLKGPFIDEIAPENVHVTLKVSPEVVENAGVIAVLWSGVSNPMEKDIISYFCPYDDKATHYVDYLPVTNSKSWKDGYGTLFLRVYNMRTKCGFRYYSNNTLVASSNPVSFTNGGPVAPLQGHISMTDKPTEMRIMWNSGLVANPIVKYGLTANLGENETAYVSRHYKNTDMCAPPANSTGYWDPGYTYDVLLKNLEPNTRYYYSYGTDEQMSRIANFTTPLPAGDKTPFKFIIYGDMGVDDLNFPEAVTTAKLARQEIDKNDVRYIFHHGDISYARGHEWIWDQWFPIIEPYSTLIPYMVGVGNHEYDHMNGHENDPSGEPNFHPSWFNGHVDSGGECSVPMYNRFHMPDTGNALYWYSYDFGMVHMIMMSSEQDYRPGSSQYTWLEKDLKSVDRNKTPFVIIAGHRAMYCSEEEFGDWVTSIYMQQYFEDLLYTYKVDIAFWAHYHSYERTCQLYKGKCNDTGTTHIVVGSAGKDIDNDQWYDVPWSMFHITDYGYGRVTVANSTHILYEFVQNRYNKVIDSVWVVSNKRHMKN